MAVGANLRPGTRRSNRVAVQLLAVGVLTACGDGPTLPVPTEPGFVLAVSIPGLTDTTVQGDSLYWRIFHRPVPIGSPAAKDLILQLLVLDPPAPLASPLIVELRWYSLEPELPPERTYTLGLDRPDGVLMSAVSYVGDWGASDGRVRLIEVTDSSITGTLAAEMVPTYSGGGVLPDVAVRATFWAPKAPDL